MPVKLRIPVVLCLDPGLVKPELKESVPAVGHEFLDYMTMNVVDPEGVSGNPIKGNAEEERVPWQPR